MTKLEYACVLVGISCGWDSIGSSVEYLKKSVMSYYLAGDPVIQARLNDFYESL